MALGGRFFLKRMTAIELDSNGGVLDIAQRLLSDLNAAAADVRSEQKAAGPLALLCDLHAIISFSSAPVCAQLESTVIETFTNLVQQGPSLLFTSVLCQCATSLLAKVTFSSHHCVAKLMEVVKSKPRASVEAVLCAVLRLIACLLQGTNLLRDLMPHLSHHTKDLGSRVVALEIVPSFLRGAPPDGKGLSRTAELLSSDVFAHLRRGMEAKEWVVRSTAVRALRDTLTITYSKLPLTAPCTLPIDVAQLALQYLTKMIDDTPVGPLLVELGECVGQVLCAWQRSLDGEGRGKGEGGIRMGFAALTRGKSATEATPLEWAKKYVRNLLSTQRAALYVLFSALSCWCSESAVTTTAATSAVDAIWELLLPTPEDDRMSTARLCVHCVVRWSQCSRSDTLRRAIALSLIPYTVLAQPPAQQRRAQHIAAVSSFVQIATHIAEIGPALAQIHDAMQAVLLSKVPPAVHNSAAITIASLYHSAPSALHTFFVTLRSAVSNASHATELLSKHALVLWHLHPEDLNLALHGDVLIAALGLVATPDGSPRSDASAQACIAGTSEKADRRVKRMDTFAAIVRLLLRSPFAKKLNAEVWAYVAKCCNDNLRALLRQLSANVSSSAQNSAAAIVEILILLHATASETGNESLLSELGGCGATAAAFLESTKADESAQSFKLHGNIYSLLVALNGARRIDDPAVRAAFADYVGCSNSNIRCEFPFAMANLADNDIIDTLHTAATPKDVSCLLYGDLGTTGGQSRVCAVNGAADLIATCCANGDSATKKLVIVRLFDVYAQALAQCPSEDVVNTVTWNTIVTVHKLLQRDLSLRGSWSSGPLSITAATLREQLVTSFMRSPFEDVREVAAKAFAHLAVLAGAKTANHAALTTQQCKDDIEACGVAVALGEWHVRCSADAAGSAPFSVSFLHNLLKNADFTPQSTFSTPSSASPAGQPLAVLCGGLHGASLAASVLTGDNLRGILNACMVTLLKPSSQVADPRAMHALVCAIDASLVNASLNIPKQLLQQLAAVLSFAASWSCATSSMAPVGMFSSLHHLCKKLQQFSSLTTPPLTQLWMSMAAQSALAFVSGSPRNGNGFLRATAFECLQSCSPVFSLLSSPFYAAMSLADTEWHEAPREELCRVATAATHQALRSFSTDPDLLRQWVRYVAMMVQAKPPRHDEEALTSKSARIGYGEDVDGDGAGLGGKRSKSTVGTAPVASELPSKRATLSALATAIAAVVSGENVPQALTDIIIDAAVDTLVTLCTVAEVMDSMAYATAVAFRHLLCVNMPSDLLARWHPQLCAALRDLIRASAVNGAVIACCADASILFADSKRSWCSDASLSKVVTAWTAILDQQALISTAISRANVVRILSVLATCAGTSIELNLKNTKTALQDWLTGLRQVNGRTVLEGLCTLTRMAFLGVATSAVDLGTAVDSDTISAWSHSELVTLQSEVGSVPLQALLGLLSLTDLTSPDATSLSSAVAELVLVAACEDFAQIASGCLGAPEALLKTLRVSQAELLCMALTDHACFPRESASAETAASQALAWLVALLRGPLSKSHVAASQIVTVVSHLLAVDSTAPLPSGAAKACVAALVESLTHSQMLAEEDRPVEGGAEASDGVSLPVALLLHCCSFLRLQDVILSDNDENRQGIELQDVASLLVSSLTAVQRVGLLLDESISPLVFWVVVLACADDPFSLDAAQLAILQRHAHRLLLFAAENQAASHLCHVASYHPFAFFIIIPAAISSPAILCQPRCCATLLQDLRMGGDGECSRLSPEQHVMLYVTLIGQIATTEAKAAVPLATLRALFEQCAATHPDITKVALRQQAPSAVAALKALLASATAAGGAQSSAQRPSRLTINVASFHP